MKTILLLLTLFLNVPSMAQLTSKALVGTYYHKEIASGDRARVDHANHYYTIHLSKDGTFSWTHQQGRLTATFRHEYGTWQIGEDDVLIITIDAKKVDRNNYRLSNNSRKYKKNSPKQKQQRQKVDPSRLIYIPVTSQEKRVIALEYYGNIYEKVRH